MKRLACFALMIVPAFCQTRMVRHATDCTAAPCYSSINIPYDSEGQPVAVTSQYLWGRQASAMTKISFEGLPQGYAVQVLRIRGNVVMWTHGGVPTPGSNSGVLWSLQTTASLGDESPTNVEYGTNGCFMYQQAATLPSQPIQFDSDLSGDAVILPDGLMWSKEAVWLNDTGLPVHEEATFIVTYRFVKQ